MSVKVKELAELTEADFKAFERVRVGGKYNMWDMRAERASKLDAETYIGVLTHYEALMEIFPHVRDDG
jgi:hypothetical protein